MNENKFINNTMTNINTFKNNICNDGWDNEASNVDYYKI